MLTQKKKTEKLSSYRDLEMEFSRVWRVRKKVVPIIVGALEQLRKD